MHVRDLVRGMARGTLCVEAATLCTKAGLPRTPCAPTHTMCTNTPCAPHTLCTKAGLPREADGGATAAAAARLRRLLTEETVGLPTQAELRS